MFQIITSYEPRDKVIKDVFSNLRHKKANKKHEFICRKLPPRESVARRRSLRSGAGIYFPRSAGVWGGAPFSMRRETANLIFMEKPVLSMKGSNEAPPSIVYSFLLVFFTLAP